MRLAAVVVVVGLLAVACGSGERADDAATDGRRAVTVFAASSLAEAFTELGEAYTGATDADVTFSFAGSSDLAAQILEGAPADVFASADLANMTRLVEADAIAGDPLVFATNVAAILVEAGNPEGIDEVADLADDDLVVVQCAAQVPCGAYAEQVVANAGVDLAPRSFEGSVSGVVTKVLLGEADAGIVYLTDVLAAGDRADGVVIPPEANVVADYPIAVVADTQHPDAGERFVEFVLGNSGQQILERHGFGAP